MEAELHVLLATHGYWVLFLVILLESAGIPLPGETVLISASVYAGFGGGLDIRWIVLLAAVAAILGDNIGFAVGRRFGRDMLLKYGQFLRIRASHLRSLERLFQVHGGKILFFGRFIALLRMFAGPLAGAHGYPWRPFLLFNAAGGIVWAGVFGYAAFTFGEVVRSFAAIASWAGLAAGAVAMVCLWRVSKWSERAAKEWVD